MLRASFILVSSAGWWLQQRRVSSLRAARRQAHPNATNDAARTAGDARPHRRAPGPGRRICLVHSTDGLSQHSWSSRDSAVRRCAEWAARTQGSFHYDLDVQPRRHRVRDAVNPRVILVDGKQLAELMIDHDVGVSVTTYRIRRVDLNYFGVECPGVRRAGSDGRAPPPPSPTGPSEGIEKLDLLAL